MTNKKKLHFTPIYVLCPIINCNVMDAADTAEVNPPSGGFFVSS